jgi:hypothetical protein
MRRAWRIPVFPLVATLLTVSVAVLVTIAAFRPLPSGGGRAGFGDMMPGALSRHLERFQTLPAQGGQSPAGPESAAADNIFQRAYPDDDIPLSRLNQARGDFDALVRRGFRNRNGQPGIWTTLGPSDAVYPFFSLRTSGLYVPNEYAAGGRTTSMAIDPNCRQGHCRLWIGAAGGGIWRTKDALQPQPDWEYISGAFAINSIGSITLDPNDSSGNTIWVGTGEFNACGSGCVAGVGLYQSTDGGDTWMGPIGRSVFDGRGVGSIAVKPGNPNTIYAASGRALFGHSSVCCAGAVTLIPGAAVWGLYRSTDAGATWTLVHNGAATVAGCSDPTTVANNLTPCSPRGVRRVEIDPSNPDILYATSYARGAWRSSDGGTTWAQIFAPIASGPATGFTERPEIAVSKLPNGKTRLYLGIGTSGSPASQLYRSDDVATGVPVFTLLSNPDPASSGYGAFNYCASQCWYDNFVYSPVGHPDLVYVLGSYQYGETGNISNGRGVVLSTDAGATFTDMTMDATDPVHPNGIHPDQHVIVVNPNDPFQFFEGSDGGVVRTSGEFADVSSDCDTRSLPQPALSRCQQLLSRVPTRIESLNNGLTTLQFQSLSVNPADVDVVQGGTQDNGTWQTNGSRIEWTETMIGDGGQSGFDPANSHFRFHTFTSSEVDVNFSDGAVADWNWVSDSFFIAGADPFAAFYVPAISDPRVSGTMYVGTGHVWRTKTGGIGSMTVDEFRSHCNEWTGDFAVLCGDWVKLGNSTSAGRLTSTTYGTDKIAAGSNNYVAAVQRSAADSSTLWAATSAGRVFVSTNADAEPAGVVAFTRIDTVSQPNRFVSGIFIDSSNPNHAWISFSGFNATTPATPGHVFEVVYDPGAGNATWTDRSYDLGDIPITGVVRDDHTGDLYISSDFGVKRLEGGDTSWALAAPGMPNEEVAGLTIATDKRKLFAASHGLGAWLLNLATDQETDSSKNKDN